MKVWSGSAWAEKPAKVWSGSAWVTKPVKVWDGSAWVQKPAGGATVPWTPSDIASSINTWLQADLLVGANGQTVTSVADSGPDSRGYATAFSTPPTLQTAGIGGKNTLSFSNQCLVTTSTIGAGITDFGLYVVWKGLTGANAKRLVDTDLTTGFWTGRSLTSDPVIGGGIGNTSDPYGNYLAADATVAHILSFERVSGMKNILIDGGVTNYSGSAESAIPLGNNLLYIATEATHYGNCIPTDLTLGEVVFIDASVTVSNRQKIEGYLAWKWGLQGSLPAGHPYKSAAPTTGAPVVPTGPTSRLITGFNAPSFRADFTGGVGWRVQLASAQTFSFIGVMRIPGNTGMHTVNLYDVSENVLRTVSIDVTGKGDYEYCWASIAPVSVIANDYISLLYQATDGGEQWCELGPCTVTSTVSNIFSAYKSPASSINPVSPNQMYVGVDLGW